MFSPIENKSKVHCEYGIYLCCLSQMCLQKVLLGKIRLMLWTQHWNSLINHQMSQIQFREAPPLQLELLIG
jgi:hypothetical protein